MPRALPPPQQHHLPLGPEGAVSSPRQVAAGGLDLPFTDNTLPRATRQEGEGQGNQRGLT